MALSYADAGRLQRELHQRGAAVAEKERALQQKRHALSELRSQVACAVEDVKQQKLALQTAKHQFFEKQRSVEERAQGKEAHNASQEDHLRRLEAQEQQLLERISSTKAEMESVVRTIEDHARESATLQETEGRLNALKRQVEEEDTEGMQLEAVVNRLEASASSRHSRLLEALPANPLPVVPTAGAVGLDATATESIILVDDGRM